MAVIETIDSISRNTNTHKTYIQAIRHRYLECEYYKSQHEDLYSWPNELGTKTGYNPLTAKRQESYVTYEELLNPRHPTKSDDERLKNSNSRLYRKTPYEQLLLVSRAQISLLVESEILHTLDRPDCTDSTINYCVQ